MAEADLKPYTPDEDVFSGHILCKIAAKIQTTVFCVFDLPESENRNVYLELGIAIGLGRPFILIKSDRSQVPSLIEGLDYFGFTSYTGLRREVGERVQVGQFSTVLPEQSVPLTNTYFVADGEFEQEDFREAIRNALQSYPLQPIYLGEGQLGPQLALTQLIQNIQTARFGVFRIDEEASANTFLALGIAIGLNKPWLLIARKGAAIPQDVRGLSNFDFHSFTHLETDFATRCAKFLQKHAGDALPEQESSRQEVSATSRDHAKKRRISTLVIGHSLDVEYVECIDWDSPEPNVADYDVVIMDLTTTQKSLPPIWAYSVTRRSQVDMSQYLQWPRIRDSVERLLLSGGLVVIIGKPEIIVAPLTPGASEKWVRDQVPLPFVPYGESMSGKSIKWVSPGLEFYFQRVRTWEYSLTGEIAESFNHAVTYETHPLAKNRADEALALEILVRGDKSRAPGVILLLPPPTEVTSSEAVELLLAHIDDLLNIPARRDASADRDEEPTVTPSRAADGASDEAAAVSPQGRSTQEKNMATRSETITWLHISDLHFRAPTGKENELHVYNANVVLQALLRDITERIHQDGLQPDFIVVTGDIAFSGKSAEYDLAQRFFNDLLAIVQLPRSCLFVVPGNHDVDRDLISQGARSIGDSLNDRDGANAILSNLRDRQLMIDRFAGYASFVNTYLNGHLSFDDQDYFYVRRLNVGERQISLLGLNSAWVSASDRDEDKRLVVGERQARSALDKAQNEGAFLKIALLHHPLDLLRSFDRMDVEPLLCDNCHFVLHGHLHQTGMAQLVGPDSGAMIIGGGACYATREYPNSYSLVQLELSSGTGSVYLRRYSDARGGFWAKDTLTYRNVPDGVYNFPLAKNLTTPKGADQHPPAITEDAPPRRNAFASSSKAPAPEYDGSAAPQPDLGTLRRRLNQAFDDPGLDSLCLEHFPDVFDKFGRGMGKKEKINVLLDHCRRLPTYHERLLAALEGQAE